MSLYNQVVVVVDDYDRARALRLIAEAGVAPGALMVSHADVDMIVAKASVMGAKIASGYICEERHCFVCGCTETTACHPEPCSWVASDLCSACEAYLVQAMATPGAAT